MKYIKNLIFLVIVLCTIFTANIYAQNAVAGDGLVTCNIDGSETGKGAIINSAVITITNTDSSGKHIYEGILLGIFKKTSTQWELVPDLQKSIFTDSLTINVQNFGDITKYEYDTVYALGYRTLYRTIGKQALIYSTDWIPINNNYFKVKDGELLGLSMNDPSITGPNELGEDVNITVFGTGISLAKYRIFYTTNQTAPEVAQGDNIDKPGEGWTDSGKVFDMTIDSPTKALATVPGTELSDDKWTYVVFKVAVATVDTKWIWRYSQAYSLIGTNPEPPTDDPQPPGPNPPVVNPPGYAVVGSGYIDRVAHNQIIYANDKYIVCTGPDTPDFSYGPYCAADVISLMGSNKFENQSQPKYRLEFDVLSAEKANQIKDVKIFLDLNSTNEKNLYLELLTPKLLKYNTTAQKFEVIKDEGLTIIKEGNNRYSIALGNDNGGVPMISANGAARYALEYSVYLTVANDPEDNLVTIRNNSQIRLYIGDTVYTEIIEPARPSHKFFIETKVSRLSVKYG